MQRIWFVIQNATEVGKVSVKMVYWLSLSPDTVVWSPPGGFVKSWELLFLFWAKPFERLVVSSSHL